MKSQTPRINIMDKETIMLNQGHASGDQLVHDDDSANVPATIAHKESLVANAASVRPIPRISIQAFCEIASTANSIQLAAEDRRLSKVHVGVNMGGAAAAVGHYQQNSTPNLIVVESTLNHDAMLQELDRLAECCDAGTKVIVIGKVNDVILYRELLRRGVSEYLVAPLHPMAFIEAVSSLYNDPDAAPVGHVIAFFGAKGGVGSSTICHNVAWSLSNKSTSSIVVADFDLAFGTTGLDFNQDPVQGIAEALQTPERLDDQLLDRLLTKYSDNLSIFAAPVVLDRDYDISADACEIVIDVVRRNVPNVIVDVPNGWSSWTKHLLLQADEVVVTAAPDLANLRNAKNVFDLLRQTRNNDGPPHLVLNTVHFLDHLAVVSRCSKTFTVKLNNGSGLGIQPLTKIRNRDFRPLRHINRIKHQMGWAVVVACLPE
ncbi:MAG: AAA family ATPase, partial [Pseudomonadota bacterium]